MEVFEKMIQIPEIVFSMFVKAMKEKFYLRAREEGNTLTPWSDFDKNWLRERLDGEIEELQQREKDYPDDVEGLMNELVDIANFCMFLWMQYRVMVQQKIGGA